MTKKQFLFFGLFFIGFLRMASSLTMPGLHLE